MRTIRITIGLLGIAAVSSALPADGADAEAPGVALPQVVVVGATPLPGVGIDADKVPGNVQRLSAADLSQQGSASLTTALDSRLSSIEVNDALDDPFQPDILYRGFEASPVLGTPQGLAVYQNGVRINEAFGNTVNWDLFPDVAINQVELVSSSPLYGLNALGGAVSVTMKDGFSYQGADLELSGGSHGRRAAVAQFGMSSGAFALYVAGRALDSVGWRELSDDRLRTVYAALGWHTERSTLDFGYTGAQDILQGQGPAPLQELAVNRSLVFTGPQENVNDLNFLTLNGTLKLGAGWSLQGALYSRHYAQSVANGNTTHYLACRAVPDTLCQPDGLTPLMNAAGQTLPDISNGGTTAIGENDFELIEAWGRGLTLQVSNDDRILGHANQLSVGAAIDYAPTRFDSGAQVGVINPDLLVLPSALVVDTPESSPGAIANGDAVPVSVNSVNRNLGAYLTDTLDATPDLAVTASGRYNIGYIDLEDRLGTNLNGSNRFVHFNPAIGATYRLRPSVTAYGGVSTNTRTPSASEIECSNPAAPCLLPSSLAGDPPSLRQVVARTSELGLRGKLSASADPSGALRWNLGVFRTVLHDDIYGIATSVSQGFFQNIGDTRRQGIELALRYEAARWSGYLSYSLVQATFESALVVASPSNPYRNSLGDIQVMPGDRLPGMPEHRLKAGTDYRIPSGWTVGATVIAVSNRYYAGDESNQLAPLPGYATVELHVRYRRGRHVEIFASLMNFLNHRYATWGILSDPTGVGAPGVPPGSVTNGPGVDNRFVSPAAPLEAFAGLRLVF